MQFIDHQDIKESVISLQTKENHFQNQKEIKNIFFPKKSILVIS